MELEYDSLYVGGKWIKPASSATITVVSASTEEVIELAHAADVVEGEEHSAVVSPGQDSVAS